MGLHFRVADTYPATALAFLDIRRCCNRYDGRQYRCASGGRTGAAVASDTTGDYRRHHPNRDILRGVQPHWSGGHCYGDCRVLHPRPETESS